MSFTKRYNAKQLKNTRRMLKALDEKLKNGEFELVTSNFWLSNLDGKITFRVVVKSKDDSKDFQEIQAKL